MERYFCLVIPLDSTVDMKVVAGAMLDLAALFTGCVGISLDWADAQNKSAKLLFANSQHAQAAIAHFRAGTAYLRPFSEN
jgi:hypothetical protein